MPRLLPGTPRSREENSRSPKQRDGACPVSTRILSRLSLEGEVRTSTSRRTLSFDSGIHRLSEEKRQAEIEVAATLAADVVEGSKVWGRKQCLRVGDVESQGSSRPQRRIPARARPEHGD